jgi:hypothetical protein
MPDVAKRSSLGRLIDSAHAAALFADALALRRTLIRAGKLSLV